MTQSDALKAGPISPPPTTAKPPQAVLAGPKAAGKAGTALKRPSVGVQPMIAEEEEEEESLLRASSNPRLNRLSKQLSGNPSEQVGYRDLPFSIFRAP